MKMTMSVILGLVVITSLYFGVHFLTQQSTKNDVAVLENLKQNADPKNSIEQFLMKALEADYVLLKATDSESATPSNDKLAWDQVSSLTKRKIAELANIKTGKLELRRRDGGYFITVYIAEGKITGSSIALPKAEE